VREYDDKNKNRSMIKGMVNNNVKVETSIVQFEFDQKVNPGVKITDPKEIKMIWDKVDKGALTGFEITITRSTKKKITNVREQTAPRLTNILSSITGIEITYKEPPLIKFIRNGKTTTLVAKTLKSSYLKPISLESIDISKLSSLLTRYSKLYMQLGHAHNGNRAFHNKDYPQAIREFFLIFEYTGCIEEIKYRNLRHAVSHVRIDDPRAINDLKNNFRIKTKPGEELDVNKPRINAILYENTRDLRNSVGLYLQEQLRIELAKKKKR
jgi:hypothetical protein